MAYRDHDQHHQRPSQQHHHHHHHHAHLDDYSPSTSGNATPNYTTTSSSTTLPSSYLQSSLTGIMGGFGGLVRRISDMTQATGQPQQQKDHNHHNANVNNNYLGGFWGGSGISNSSLGLGGGWSYQNNNGINGVYTPPIHRSASPMAPPPLEPLKLKGFREDTLQSARLLTPAVAEEIRIMVPERQRIEDEWNLVYSLEQDGASLATLYKMCSEFEDTRTSFVLVVKDNEGGLFGAYLSDAPHVWPHYFGNGECFLWRASLLAALPPPPSEDTTNLTRVTTIASPTRNSFPKPKRPPPPPVIPEPEEEEDLLIDLSDDPPAQPRAIPEHLLNPQFSPTTTASPTTTLSPTHTGTGTNHPSRTASPAPSSIGPSIRFKAFPYSGENNFYMYCEPHWLSIGGGDGHYGLWLNDSLEKGVSSRCLTFGNEPLSDEGEKFGVVGVEVWLIGRGGRR